LAATGVGVGVGMIVGDGVVVVTLVVEVAQPAIVNSNDETRVIMTVWYELFICLFLRKQWSVVGEEIKTDHCPPTTDHFHFS
jgi:hypothetical protein